MCRNHAKLLCETGKQDALPDRLNTYRGIKMKIKKRKLKLRKQKNAHNTKEKIPAGYCHCGCGEKTRIHANIPNKFINGHQNRGKCHNRTGRPLGSRSNSTLWAQNLIKEDIEVIVEQVVNSAKNGNINSAKFLVQKIIPDIKSVPIKIKGFPKVTDAESAQKAISFILQSVATGEISVLDGEGLTRCCERFLSAGKIQEIESDLKSLISQLEL